MADNILSRTLMDEHLMNVELAIKNTLYRFKAFTSNLDQDFLDDFEEKTVDRVNQVCEQFKSTYLRNVSSSSSSGNVVATRMSAAPQSNIMKRKSINTTIATRSKRLKPVEIQVEFSEEDSSSSSDSGPESENIGKKYVCIVGIHDSLIKDERKLRETFQKLCQILSVNVLDRDIEKIYTNKQVKPHSLIVMLKRSELSKQIISHSNRINISPHLNVIIGKKSANKITIGPYNIPGWSRK